MKWFLIACLSLPLFAGGAAADGALGGPIKIQASPDYRQGAAAANILNECTELSTSLTNFTETFAAKNGLEVQKLESVTKDTPGTAVVIEITQVHSGGNAFIGHSKSVTLYAELYQDGKRIDSKTFSRDSGGGFGAGFKGSCSVLARCMKTLGSDLAKWMATHD